MLYNLRTRKKNLFRKGIKIFFFLLFTIIYPNINMLLRQLCLSNNLQTRIRKNADFLLQNPQQLPSAEANFEGCMIDCYQYHGLLSSTHVLITQSHSCIHSVWTILYGQLGKLLKTTYRSAFRRVPLKNISIRPSTYQKTRWRTF